MKNNYLVSGEVTHIFVIKRSGELVEFTVSTSDLQFLLDYGVTWCADFDKKTSRYYIKGHKPGTNNGKVQLHRVLLGLTTEKVDVDHKNMNTLDNTRNNLRITNRTINNLNRKPSKKNTSGVTGVYFNKREQKWIAQMYSGGKTRVLGRFLTKEEAVKCRKDKEKELGV